MKRFLLGAVLTGLLLAGSGLLAASSTASGCPANCCTSPDDCPQPACCRS